MERDECQEESGKGDTNGVCSSALYCEYFHGVKVVRPMRVLIIDEHDAVRQALETCLRRVETLQVVGSTARWQEGVAMAADRRADVVLLETKRSDGQGLAALRRLRAECPLARVIVLTSYPDPDERREALRLGAARYLLKDLGSDRLVREILSLVAPYSNL